MKRLILVLLALLLVACDLPTPTEPGPGTETPTVTVSPSPSASPTPTQPATIIPTHEPILGDNVIEYPGFEGNYRKVIYGEVNVEEHWAPFYIEGVPSDKPGQPLLGRPEYKPIDIYNYPARVHSGELAQTWFCFFRPCRAGVYRTFEVWAGYDYKFSIWVQSWSSFDDDPESELDTEDNRAASQWAIKIDPLGGDDPDAVAMFVCYLGGIAHYDNWVEFSCEFHAETNQATIFVENTRPWGLRNQDSYTDDASLACYDCPHLPFQTPTPIAPQTPGPTPTPSPTYAPTPTPERTLDEHILMFGENAFYQSELNMVIRSNHSTNGAVMGQLDAGTGAPAIARYIGDNGDRWACIDEAAQIVPNEEYDWLLILECKRWVAMSLGTAIYGNVYE